MLNTVLFDMGGTLEDIWNNEETLAAVMEQLQAMLREAGLEPGCGLEDFQRKVLAGLKAYKSWICLAGEEAGGNLAGLLSAGVRV